MRNLPAPKNHLHYLLLLPLALGLLACRTAYQVAGLLPTATPTPLPPTTTPTPLPTFTPTPLPTLLPTATPTRFVPSPTLVDAEGTPTIAPTPIPLDLQLNVFQAVWETVRDNYLYADYNGLDWEAVHTETQAKIEAGLTNDEFYGVLYEMIYSLGDEHSFYLSPAENLEWEAEYQGDFNYVGIGVYVVAVPEHNHAVILSIFPGSPAEAAGLKSRDAILARMASLSWMSRAGSNRSSKVPKALRSRSLCKPLAKNHAS